MTGGRPDLGAGQPAEAGAGDLAPEDRQLMAEHQALGVLGEGVHPSDREELHDATYQAVEGS